MRRAVAILILVPALLVFLGVAIVASTSDVISLRLYGSPNGFLLRQALFAVAAVVAVAIVSFCDYRLLQHKWVMALLLVAVLVGLVVVFVPGLAAAAKGGHRWIRAGPLRLQPSEFIRLLLIVLMAAWHGEISRKHERFGEGFAIPGLILGIVCAGFLKQRDLGAMFLAGVASMTLMFVSGVRMRHLTGAALVGAAVIVGAIVLNPERLSRVVSVYSPEASAADDRHQIEQSLAAFQSGGVWGVGYTRSLRKEHYLPESHTDFIFAMIGEELGLWCTLAVVGAYALLLVSGLTVGLRSQDKFGRLLAFGMTFHLCFSAGFNFWVVTRLAPTKGLALPFISYGGSSLLASAIALGTVLSVARKANVRPPLSRRLGRCDVLPGLDFAPCRSAISAAETP